MNRIEAFQALVSEQGRSIFEYTADWVEWSAKKNLEIADDFAEFTVAQLRLPVETQGFTGYRLGLRDSYGELGEELKRHGEDYVSKLKEMPAEIRAIFEPEKKAATKAPAKPKTVKKTAKPAKAKAKAKA
jgi:hypothetical protein